MPGRFNLLSKCEKRDIYSKKLIISFMPGIDINELAKMIFESILSECQNNLFEKIKGSDFAFD